MFRFVSCQRCGDVFFDILITSKRRFGSGYVLIHFETLMGV